MNTLDRYLYKTIILYTVMATSVLLTLAGLFVFIGEQSDIGVGNYSAADAVLYTLLNLPQELFDLLPIGALIGALMGLGNLAAGSELVVTRASGVSVWRVAWPVALAGVTLALAMYAIGEYVAPPLAQFAHTEKTTSRLADVSFAGRASAWIKEGNLILRLRTGEVGQVFGGAALFELNGPGRLSSIETADSISVADPGSWMLENVRMTTFEPGRVVATHKPEVTIRSTISPDFLGLAATDPDLLTLRSLAAYIEHLRRNHLQAVPYEISFWSRIARIFAVVIVTMLSLPFVFGPLRTTGAGTRTVVGVLLGVVFFVINGIGEKGGQLFGLNPILIGWLPTAVIGVGTMIAISRTR
ncbi:MAG TPA: LPS export ABC transporter permease LptG [Steroidobacteraceae bacterium]|nr:LPS export ABC transporter permease LptG [Steroidobacteraceae bacterium]